MRACATLFESRTATFADPKKVAVIKDILPCSKTNPWSKTAVKSFAGMTVYYRMFIMGYARYMKVLATGLIVILDLDMPL